MHPDCVDRYIADRCDIVSPVALCQLHKHFRLGRGQVVFVPNGVPHFIIRGDFIEHDQEETSAAKMVLKNDW